MRRHEPPTLSDWEIELTLMQMLRAAAFWVFAVFFFLLSVDSFVHAQTLDAIRTEHRFTELETTVKMIAEDVHDMRQYNWIALLGMAGLLGEAGLRVVKGRKKPEA